VIPLISLSSLRLQSSHPRLRQVKLIFNRAKMGGTHSKSSAFSEGGGRTLASPTPIDNSHGGRPQQLPQQQTQQRLPQQHEPPHGPRQHSQPQTTQQTADARGQAAAAAAEQRMKAENKRGVNAANPNSGQLAAQLEASKTAPIAPEPSRREDTLIDDWRNRNALNE